MKADGFDEAIIGYAERCGNSRVFAYDSNKVIQILMENDGMTYDEALEFFEFNILGAYVGEQTPVFVFIDENAKNEVLE